jgi:GrpB-like predicted nucleotidyltransferase (UPF0157 family)
LSERPIGRYESVPAVCRPHDPRSPEVAETLSAMIQDQSPGLSVEHVGSTAVPGCAGKGVVDLTIPYREGQLETTRRVLEELGFQRQSTRDPFPEDRPMRVGSIEHEGDEFRLHVHVISTDSEEVRELRAFRDRLRSDPDLLGSYVERKRRIIEAGTTDSVDYAEAKGSFIVETLSRRGT